MIYQKTKPILLYGWGSKKEQISSFLLSHEFTSVITVEDSKNLFSLIAKYGDVNILLDRGSLFSEMENENNIESFITICLNIGNSRIIYFTDSDLSGDSIVKLLFENKRYDIHKLGFGGKEEFKKELEQNNGTVDDDSSGRASIEDTSQRGSEDDSEDEFSNRFKITKKGYEVKKTDAEDVEQEQEQDGSNARVFNEILEAVTQVMNFVKFKELLEEEGLTVESLSSAPVEMADIKNEIQEVAEEGKGLVEIQAAEQEEDESEQYLLEGQEYNSFYEKYMFFVFLIETILKESNKVTLSSFLQKYSYELSNLRNFIKEQWETLTEVRDLINKKNTFYEELLDKFNASEAKVKELESSIKDYEVTVQTMNENISEMKEFNSELEKSVIAVTDRLREGSDDSAQFISVKSSEYDSFKKVIYFKEVTEAKYFNTFILRTMEKLNKAGMSVGCFIFEAADEYSNKKLALTGGIQVINTSSENGIYKFDKQIVMLNILNKEVLNSILVNNNEYDYIFIVDRMHKNLKLIVGWNSELLYISGRKEDSDVFNIPHDKLITNNLDSALINLNQFERYNELTKLLKMKVYQEAVDKFIGKIVMRNE